MRPRSPLRRRAPGAWLASRARLAATFSAPADVRDRFLLVGLRLPAAEGPGVGALFFWPQTQKNTESAAPWGYATLQVAYAMRIRALIIAVALAAAGCRSHESQPPTSAAAPATAAP